MKDRIRIIMEKEQLTPSAFADKLQLGRAVISHILNGRNNPSLDVANRILAKVPYIDAEWLLTGKGSMYKSDMNKNSTGNQTPIYNSSINDPLDLFSQNYEIPSIDKPETEYRKENTVEQSKKIDEEVINQPVIYQKAPERKVSKIIIYYSDNTFETFNADNRPL